MGTPVTSSIVLSPDGQYRYSYSLEWGPGPHVVFIGLNPSCKDGNTTNATLRRVIEYARSWGMGRVSVVNLFAYCARNPQQLLEVDDPVGPDNDRTILEVVAKADMVVASWGVWGHILARGDTIRSWIPHLHVLELTKTGSPHHPLRLPLGLKPKPWVS